MELREEFISLSRKSMSRVSDIIITAGLIEEYQVNDYKTYLRDHMHKNAGTIKRIISSVYDMPRAEFNKLVAVICR